MTLQRASVLAVNDEYTRTRVTAAAAIGAASWSVDSVDAFSSAGGNALVDGTTVVAYTGKNATTNTLLFAGGAPVAVAADANVEPYPQFIERIATLQIGKDDEPVTARVRHGLKSRLHVGIRDDTTREWVTVESDDFGVWAVKDIYGAENRITDNVVVAGMLIAPARTGWRVEIGDATYPLRYWDGTTTKFSVDNAGNVMVAGAISASSIDIPAAGVAGFHVSTAGRVSFGGVNAPASDTEAGHPILVTATGLIKAPSTGWRVEIGDATTPVRYWDGSTTKFSLDNAGNILVVGTLKTAITGGRMEVNPSPTEGQTISFYPSNAFDQPGVVGTDAGFSNGSIKLTTPYKTVAGAVPAKIVLGSDPDVTSATITATIITQANNSPSGVVAQLHLAGILEFPDLVTYTGFTPANAVRVYLRERTRSVSGLAKQELVALWNGGASSVLAAIDWPQFSAAGQLMSSDADGTPVIIASGSGFLKGGTPPSWTTTVEVPSLLGISTTGLAQGVLYKDFVSAGVISVGDVVRASTTTAGQVERTTAATDHPVGVALDAAAGAGTTIRVAIAGVVQVTVDTGSTTSIGSRVGPGAANGRAQTASGIVIGSARGVLGVALEASASGTNRLVWIMLATSSTAAPTGASATPAAVAAAGNEGSGTSFSRGGHIHPLGIGTTRGDIIVWDLTPTPVRLAIGGAGTFLRSSGSDPSWQAIAFTDVGGVATKAQLPATTAYTDASNTFTVAQVMNPTNTASIALSIETATNATSPGLRISGGVGHTGLLVNLREQTSAGVYASRFAVDVTGVLNISNVTHSILGTATTAGFVLRAASTTTFAFAQLQFSDLGGSLSLAQIVLSTVGDILTVDATPALARVAGNTTNTPMYLRSVGTGAAATVPAWSQIAFTEISGTLTKAQQHASTAYLDVTQTFTSAQTFTPASTSAVPIAVAAPDNSSAVALRVTGGVGQTGPLLNLRDQTSASVFVSRFSVGASGAVSLSNVTHSILGTATTAGFVLRALTTTTFGFDSIKQSDLPTGTPVVKVVEIDFGAIPKQEAQVTLTDAAVTASSHVMVQVTNEQVSNYQNEADMDYLLVSARPGAGQFTVWARGLDSPFQGKFKLLYTVST